MTHHQQSRFISFCAPTLLAALIGGFVPGCGQESAESAAVRQARLDLEYLAANSGVAPQGKGLTYDKIISSLSAASSSSIQGEADAARLIRAQANSRGADLIAAAAAARERESLAHVIRIRATLDRWRHLNDSAAALKSFDPAEALDALAKQATAKDAEIATAARELSLAEGALAQLRAKAADAQKLAQDERAKEALFRSQAIDKSQTQRADLITQANLASRAGDALEKTASDLLAQAATQQPALDQAKILLDSLRSQRALIDTSRAEIEGLVRVNADESRKTIDGEKGSADSPDRVGVKQLQTELLAQLAALETLRTKAPEGAESLDQLYDAAQKRYSTAASEVAKVRSAGGKSNTSTLTVAGSKHAEADLLMSKAHGLDSYASLLEVIADASPALPGDFAVQAKAARDAHTAALTAARDSYSAARADYDSAGNREQLERVKSRLETIGKTLATFDPRAPQAPADNAEQPAPTGDAAADTAPVSPTATTPPVAAIPEGAAGEVVAAVTAMSAELRKPDLQAFMTHVIFRNDKQKENFTKSLPIVTQSIELDKACVEVFKMPLLEVMLKEGTQMNATTASVSDNDRAISYFTFADPADFDVSISQDNPELADLKSVSGKLSGALRFRNQDGQWKWMMEVTENDFVQDDKIATFADALKNITAKVRAGDYGEHTGEFVKNVFDEMVKAFIAQPDK